METSTKPSEPPKTFKVYDWNTYQRERNKKLMQDPEYRKKWAETCYEATKRYRAKRRLLKQQENQSLPQCGGSTDQ